jgi:protein-S-isoprenylcysteine O-methyltransferase
MIKRLFLGIVISAVVVIAPVLGNIEILGAPQLWILLAFGVLASIFQPGYNPVTIAAKEADGGTGAQIIWSVYITQLAAILESAYVRYPRSVEWDLVATIALVAMACGLALRSWAVLTLGELFTMHIAVQDGHAVIRTGPYRIVRHPSYLGAFIMYLATTLFLHAWIAAVLAAAVLPLAFVRRIHHEEKMLKRELGPAYESYCADVKKLIPGLW